MAKIHEKVGREGRAAAGKAESRIKKAINTGVKPFSKKMRSGGRRPGDKK